MNEETRKKASRIRMLLLDVDGVLTDGRLIFGPDGGEYKCFCARDGLGTILWHAKGNRMAFVTRRCTEVVRRRAEELKIDALYQGILDKCSLLETIQQDFGLSSDQVAYVGDDLVDLRIMERVGFSAAPADAVSEILAMADYVTSVCGGKGAVREVIEVILKARDEWRDFGF